MKISHGSFCFHFFYQLTTYKETNVSGNDINIGLYIKIYKMENMLKCKSLYTPNSI